MRPQGPFALAGPRWLTIPAHRPFLDDLARGLHAALSPLGPEALADAVVLIPTRRGARALADAFVRTAGGGAVLLPQIRALGDLDEGEPPFEPGDLALELPPAIAPLRRRFELARLVAEHEAKRGETVDAAAALALGDALGELLDSLHIEKAFDADKIAGLVEGDLARHWQRSAEFLKVATELWPARLAELGLVDPAERRVRLLDLLAEQWETKPPQVPLIAAGSTGSAPSVARVLAAVAAAPQGCVVLPGLDLDLATSAWDQIDDQHPQAAMKALLDSQGLDRQAIEPWPTDEGEAAKRLGRARRRVINEALRPAQATADWLRLIADLREEAPPDADPVRRGLEGLALIDARHEEEAATVAALLLREALETPGETCALVTPDQALARRVSARLSRWGVEADSSAGTPLSALSVGVLIALVARLAIDPLDPVTLLAVLKHPLVRLRRSPEALSAARRALERRGLRGPAPRTAERLAERLADEPDALALATDVAAITTGLSAPFSYRHTAAPDAAARALVEAVEALAADETGAAGSLWGGLAGEAAAELLADLIAEGSALPPATARGFQELIETLLSGVSVRAGGAAHPRLRILGVIEARLVQADRIILAGLEEGVWPRGAAVDPFLSRPMRRQLGLPSPERRVGQAAHDFAQAVSAPRVTLITTQRRGGQPAVRSRWIWRLETLAKGAGQALPGRPELLAWARALDAPIAPAPAALRPAERPQPRPPVDVRPRQMPVTRIEAWVRDPYSVYGRTILKLRQLDLPGAPLDARGRGTAVHAAFERLALDHPDLPADTAKAFEALLLHELEQIGYGPAEMARERPLAANLSRWVEDFERARRPGARILVETEGKLTFAAPGGDFTVTAKADRIEVRGAQADVLDFKTGAAPSAKQVETGFSPQLTLTGAILMGGGFEAIGPIEPGELVYVRVSGRREPGKAEVRARRGESLVLAQAAYEGLQRRVALFDREETPYASWVAPQFLKDRGGDYDHLARLWEWAVVGGDGDEGGES